VDDQQVELAWNRLAAATDEAVRLLQSVGESFWATRLAAGTARIDTFGANGLDPILGMFGGMGSLNDLWLHPMNGHVASEEELRAANDRLAELREEIYESATALRRAFPS
jgi:hypothetical protein